MSMTIKTHRLLVCSSLLKRTDSEITVTLNETIPQHASLAFELVTIQQYSSSHVHLCKTATVEWITIRGWKQTPSISGVWLRRWWYSPTFWKQRGRKREWYWCNEMTTVWDSHFSVFTVRKMTSADQSFSCRQLMSVWKPWYEEHWSADILLQWSYRSICLTVAYF